jgi:hypothetical protein
MVWPELTAPADGIAVGVATVSAVFAIRVYSAVITALVIMPSLYAMALTVTVEPGAPESVTLAVEVPVVPAVPVLFVGAVPLVV